MDPTAYRQFLELEREHWWFRSRRTLYFDLLQRAVQRWLRSSANGSSSSNGSSNGDARTLRPLRSLDVGCGMGGMLGELRRFGEPCGVEIEAEGVAICRERGFPSTLVGSGYELPHPDESFDLITLFDTIEHIDDDRRVLRECRRILRPGGILMATVPAYQFLYANNDRIAHHKRRYTRSQLVGKMREAELEVLKGTYVNTLLFPLILPAVLLIKLKERIVRKSDDDTTNLSYGMSPLVNGTLERIFSSERFPLRWISFPVGHSLAVISRK